jgi:uncharacterized NAD-dependent epimerase/dehydratase family protein
MLQANQRVAILLSGGVRDGEGKTGLAMLRYRKGPIVAVIDAETAGQSLRALTGIEREVPIVADVASALKYEPEVLVIGLAPSGGQLPAPDYAQVKAAVAAGLSVANGLHTRLAEDASLRAFLQPGQWLWDIRQEPEGLTVGSGKARLLDCKRVLAVGTDMGVGKMSTCLELHTAAQARGLRSRFVGTGQAGILISGGGIPLDAVRVDFASGAVEQAVLAAADGAEIMFVEGQGSLVNPASTATLPLLRGSQPTALVLVHRLGQTHIRKLPDILIPALPKVIEVYEAVANMGGALGPCRVAGIALNTWGVSEAEAWAGIEQVKAETGLPCSDVVRFGAELLLDVVVGE